MCRWRLDSWVLNRNQILCISDLYNRSFFFSKFKILTFNYSTPTRWIRVIFLGQHCPQLPTNVQNVMYHFRGLCTNNFWQKRINKLGKQENNNRVSSPDRGTSKILLFSSIFQLSNSSAFWMLSRGGCNSSGIPPGTWGANPVLAMRMLTVAASCEKCCFIF